MDNLNLDERRELLALRHLRDFMFDLKSDGKIEADEGTLDTLFTLAFSFQPVRKSA